MIIPHSASFVIGRTVEPGNSPLLTKWGQDESSVTPVRRAARNPPARIFQSIFASELRLQNIAG
jgi:hypothetical protein